MLKCKSKIWRDWKSHESLKALLKEKKKLRTDEYLSSKKG